jgi:hypothetical protein
MQNEKSSKYGKNKLQSFKLPIRIQPASIFLL